MADRPLMSLEDALNPGYITSDANSESANQSHMVHSLTSGKSILEEHFLFIRHSLRGCRVLAGNVIADPNQAGQFLANVTVMRSGLYQIEVLEEACSLMTIGGCQPLIRDAVTFDPGRIDLYKSYAEGTGLSHAIYGEVAQFKVCVYCKIVAKLDAANLQAP